MTGGQNVENLVIVETPSCAKSANPTLLASKAVVSSEKNYMHVKVVGRL